MKKIQKEIEDLQMKANKLNSKLQNKKDEYTRLVSIPELRKVIGKCFKYHNSYGGDRERWYLYTKVISIDEKTMTFTTIEFQRTSMDIMSIELQRKYNWDGKNYFSGNSYIPISNSEYNKAKKSALKFITEKLCL